MVLLEQISSNIGEHAHHANNKIEIKSEKDDVSNLFRFLNAKNGFLVFCIKPDEQSGLLLYFLILESIEQQRMEINLIVY